MIIYKYPNCYFKISCDLRLLPKIDRPTRFTEISDELESGRGLFSFNFPSFKSNKNCSGFGLIGYPLVLKLSSLFELNTLKLLIFSNLFPMCKLR